MQLGRFLRNSLLRRRKNNVGFAKSDEDSGKIGNPDWKTKFYFICKWFRFVFVNKGIRDAAGKGGGRNEEVAAVLPRFLHQIN